MSFLIPFAIIGLFICWHVIRPQKSPADKSNRINKIRLIWFVLTREDLFVDIFPWLKNDELVNVSYNQPGNWQRLGEFVFQIEIGSKGFILFNPVNFSASCGWDAKHFSGKDEVLALFKKYGITEYPKAYQ